MAEFIFDMSDGTPSLIPKRALIRCKNCKWYDKDRSLCDNTIGLPLPREQNFFCADGVLEDET